MWGLGSTRAPHLRHREDDTLKGFAFVEFAEVEQARQAVAQLSPALPRVGGPHIGLWLYVACTTSSKIR